MDGREIDIRIGKNAVHQKDPDDRADDRSTAPHDAHDDWIKGPLQNQEPLGVYMKQIKGIEAATHPDEKRVEGKGKDLAFSQVSVFQPFVTQGGKPVQSSSHRHIWTIGDDGRVYRAFVAY